MYGGRVLKAGKTLGQYKIEEGMTIFYMIKKPSERECCMSMYISIVLESGKCGEQGVKKEESQLKRLAQNPRVHQIVSMVFLNLKLIHIHVSVFLMRILKVDYLWYISFNFILNSS